MKRHCGQRGRPAARGLERLEPRLPLAGQPVISEFLASNDATIEDGFGQDSDWIELTNIGDAPVDLQGYYLSDSVSNLTKWSFPASTILNPGQYLVVFASDLNTVDPQGYYHTNYKLSAEGEDVVLATPDQTIISQIGPGGDDYPPQLTDVSYGYAGPVLVDGNSSARYLIPTNGSLGTSWTNLNFDASANGFLTGKAAVGYDTTTTPTNYAQYFHTPLPAGTTSVYVRSEFELASAAAVNDLNLFLRYDDGFVAYLNGTKVAEHLAPATPLWNSTATDSRSDGVVVQGVEFSLDAHLNLLQSGKNVLAIHLLNQGSSSSDLLLDLALATSSSTAALGYLSAPTPGAANSSLAQFGPVVEAGAFAPNQPIAGQPLKIDATVTPFLAAVNPATVKMTYRVMYGAETTVSMYDDGATAGDAVAGDGVYAAQIPGTAFAAGQMVRWYVTAEDVNGLSTRAPRFSDPLDSPQYYGTVAVDPSIATDLPVIHWFVQSPGAAATDTGTRTSLYLFGQFYDNVQVDLHGQSTTQPQFTKKSYNFDANNGLKFDFPTSFGRVSDFNLLTNQADKTYYRNTIAYDLYGAAGGPALGVFSAVVQRNGAYYGLYDVVEEAQSEFLERVGLDPDGALYKMGNGFDSATSLVEKKTRTYENNSDLQALVNTWSLNSLQGEIWVDDNLNLASWVNYFAVQTVIANRDYGQKNYYLYRDTNETGLWSLLPWDLDLSFGHQWNPTENYFDDDLIFNDGFYVYQGGNHLITRLINLPQFTAMYRRRVRTLLDDFYGAPGEPIDQSLTVQKIDALMAQIGVDALQDRNVWGAPGGMAYETPEQAVARVEANFLAARKTFLGSFPGLPAPQVAAPDVAFGLVDYAPLGGNQDQEYVAVVNRSTSAVDVSGWSIAGAVNHTFAGGTVIPAGFTYYAVADVAQFKQRTSGPTGGQRLFIQGNFDGRLDDAGGLLLLKNSAGAVVASKVYGAVSNGGDYTFDGEVDGADLLAWQRQLGAAAAPVGAGADGNANGTVDAPDLEEWRLDFGGPPALAAGAAHDSAALTAHAAARDAALTSLAQSAPALGDLLAPTTARRMHRPLARGVRLLS